MLWSATEVMELYCVSIEVDFCFGLQQERLCKTDLSRLKLSVSIANPCSKLLTTEVKGSVLGIWEADSLCLGLE